MCTLTLDSQDIKQLAHLARLEFDEDAADSIANSINNVLALVEKLTEANMEDVAPLAHPLELTQRLREDLAVADDRRESAKRNAPEMEADLFLVPKVVD